MISRKVKTKGIPPCPRAAHSGDIVKEKLYIFGGWNGYSAFDDVHVLDLKSMMWSEITKIEFKPVARNNHRTAVFGHKIYLYGGHDGNKWWVSTGDWLDT